MPIAQSTGGAQKSVSEIPTMTSYWKDASDFTITFDSWLANQGKIAQMIWKYELKNTIFTERKSLFSDQVTPKLWSNEYNVFTYCLPPTAISHVLIRSLLHYRSPCAEYPKHHMVSPRI